MIASLVLGLQVCDGSHCQHCKVGHK